jgi:Uri superfamily endonuclease
LVIALGVGLRLRIGKLGIHDLPPGYYVYVGSALGGLSSRLRRHLRSEKRFHWHIDYLLQQTTVAEIWYTIGPDRLECKWNAILRNLPEATPSILGFGASDCWCSSHLTYFRVIPPFGLFKQGLEKSKLPQVQRLNEFTSFNHIQLASSFSRGTKVVKYVRNGRCSVSETTRAPPTEPANLGFILRPVEPAF